MSLSNLVRAASRVVPSAIRASAGRQCRSHRLYSSALSSAVNGRLMGPSLRRPFPSFLHHYSTETSSDESLLHLLRHQIECANRLSEAEKAEDLPEGFPFKIEDRVGTKTITLTREYQGETITVEVQMPDPVTGQYEGEDGRDDSSIPIIVKTSKKDGPYLEFSCTAYPDEVTIESLSVIDPDLSDEQIGYEGPDFMDLDENLQKAMHRYLEIRGVKPSTTNFFHMYMIQKETKEFIEWLKKVSKFLKA